MRCTGMPRRRATAAWAELVQERRGEQQHHGGPGDQPDHRRRGARRELARERQQQRRQHHRGDQPARGEHHRGARGPPDQPAALRRGFAHRTTLGFAAPPRPAPRRPARVSAQGPTLQARGATDGPGRASRGQQTSRRSGPGFPALSPQPRRVGLQAVPAALPVPGGGPDPRPRRARPRPVAGPSSTRSSSGCSIIRPAGERTPAAAADLLGPEWVASGLGEDP